MATLARLQARAALLGHQYYFRNSVVDVFRKKENEAAVKIQSWFRGCQVRTYIRYLHRVATVIQKWWRSYLGRKYYHQKIKMCLEEAGFERNYSEFTFNTKNYASIAKTKTLAYDDMKMNIYNAMAVRIQKRWRGYKIRKYCFNYSYFKAYLRAISETNDAVRDALDEFAEMKEREEKKAALEREEKKRDYEARKMHYLLSTKQIPGVYNSPFRKEPDPWELRLQKARPLTPPRPKAKRKRVPNLSSWLACTSTRSFPRSHILPPIDRKQCQGPFRDISEVLKQRYKPLEPTLRVAEPINTLKEARTEFRRWDASRNIHENMFLPFSSYHKNGKYVPSMHLSSKYAFGYHRFRDENPSKWIGGKDFQTVLPPFDLFSKYGKAYSKAGQIL